jgi:hypothetical protein
VPFSTPPPFDVEAPHAFSAPRHPLALSATRPVRLTCSPSRWRSRPSPSPRPSIAWLVPLACCLPSLPASTRLRRERPVRVPAYRRRRPPAAAITADSLATRWRRRRWCCRDGSPATLLPVTADASLISVRRLHTGAAQNPLSVGDQLEIRSVTEASERPREPRGTSR